MLVSVITPAYNAEATLERACDSVAGQTFPDWEHVIVDDGSTDRTRAIAESCAAADARVRVFSTENSGTSAALNRGIAEARGDFIAFLDADDEYHPDHIAKHLEVMHADPGVDVLWGGIDLVVNREEDAMVPDAERGEGLIHIGECVVQGTLFVRRKVIEQVLFDESLRSRFQDYDFHKRAAQRFRSARFPFATYRYYRTSPSSEVARIKEGWPGG